MNKRLLSGNNYFLNSHAQVLFDEYNVAFKNKMWASVIILSLTIIDNILTDERILDYIDGLDLNELKRSKDLRWLRIRRNKILHYEGPIEGFYGNGDSQKVLKLDAERANKILNIGLRKILIK